MPPTPSTPIARYFPIERPPYKVTAGLSKLTSDFGNGDVDQKLIQLDSDFWRYRNNKLICRQERLTKYILNQYCSPILQPALCRSLIELLCNLYPTWFTGDGMMEGRFHLICHLTNETLTFDKGHFQPELSHFNITPAYTNGLDALACQIQEDLAVVCQHEKRDWLAALHVCAPGHWAPEDKIGHDFAHVHTPVPGIQPIVQAQSSMVNAMIHKGPFVRFVWGLGSDNRLNHHPDPPPGESPTLWQGRKLSLAANSEDTPPFYLRVERQTMTGLPDKQAAFFFIHVYHLDGRDILANDNWRQRLRESLETMDDATLAYKGFTQNKTALICLLK